MKNIFFLMALFAMPAFANQSVINSDELHSTVTIAEEASKVLLYPLYAEKKYGSSVPKALIEASHVLGNLAQNGNPYPLLNTYELVKKQLGRKELGRLSQFFQSSFEALDQEYRHYSK